MVVSKVFCRTDLMLVDCSISWAIPGGETTSRGPSKVASGGPRTAPPGGGLSLCSRMIALL
jgi:hypothetical protein